MTELDTMKRARMYLDLLAKGMDPITGGPLPRDCGLDNERLGRCFAYVGGVLDQVIANGGVVGAPVRYVPFDLPPRQRANVMISREPVTVTQWIEALHRAAENPEMKKLRAVSVSDWLVSLGLMVKQTTPEGRTHRVPTQEGQRMGITARSRQSRDGEYLAVFYDERAQRFLMDNLDTIIARDRSTKKEK